MQNKASPDAQLIQHPFNTHSTPNSTDYQKVKLPMPREFNGNFSLLN